MYKIAVLGDRESIYGYAALGLSVFETDRENVGALIEKLAKEKYAIIYVTENVALGAEEQIESFKERQIPAIILIPAISGNTGLGVAGIHKSVEKAVGSDILGGK
ncbi:MAG: V-type ATP synthase subunit F [Clostridiales bacterium]|nr:V-type ATP synthase subunit F [Candidatus Equinaster intestinalis]